MTPVPNTVFINYETTLKKRSVKIDCYADYKKWLRYYLDFSAKYPLCAGADGEGATESAGYMSSYFHPDGFQP